MDGIAVFIPRTLLPVEVRGQHPEIEQWIVLQATGFNALLTISQAHRSNTTAMNGSNGSKPAASHPIATPSPSAPAPDGILSITFDPVAIAQSLTPFAPHLDWQALANKDFADLMQALSPNHPDRQSEFTLRLMQALTTELQASQPIIQDLALFKQSIAPPYPPVCQPVELALRQQLEQERLSHQVITQLRQSLDLPVILETAVEQVRQFLKVDRLVIYQLAVEQSTPTDLEIAQDLLPQSQASSTTLKCDRSCITYESRANEDLPSTLGFTDSYCFSKLADFKQQYIATHRYVLAVTDVMDTYAHTPCLLNMLSRLQVKSKLVVPIVVQDDLWGLLIAHQCDRPRQWPANEQTFLTQIAEHLSVAIWQAQLYGKLQKQKVTLEQRVTERTENLRDAMSAAQAANRTKTEFLATMSHELRTPLTSIIGMSTTLIRWAGDTLSSRQQNYLQTIHDSGKHLLDLINDILDLSQVEAGRMVLELQDLSLAGMAHHTLQMVQEQAQAKQVELQIATDIAPNGDRFVADPKRVRQILLNLLTNAIKFTPAGGSVVLRVIADEFGATFQVKDTGIGIPTEKRSLLFRKFQQLETTYNREHGGTGLGLALTKQLVELHGGSIDVESTVGIGSVFTVRLPSRQLSSEKTTAAPVPNSPPKGRIVLIEQDEEIATLICDLLNTAGYDLVWIMEGLTALDRIKLLEPIAVIVDLHLADTDGVRLIQQLQHPILLDQSLSVIALYRESKIHTQDVKSLGVDVGVTLPLNPDQLLHAVNGLVH